MRRTAEVAAICGVEVYELEIWVSRHWLLPTRDRGTLMFTEADVARTRMIAELRHELAIDEETMPVVLSLLDQVHFLRGQLRRLAEAVSDLPEADRTRIMRRLTADDEPRRS